MIDDVLSSYIYAKKFKGTIIQKKYIVSIEIEECEDCVEGDSLGRHQVVIRTVDGRNNVMKFRNRTQAIIYGEGIFGITHEYEMHEQERKEGADKSFSAFTKP